MFELGLRLAFDKPTIIIKDDATNYSFDTSLIEHLTYPRDLRYNAIIEFKRLLKKKIADTFIKGKDPAYSTFLKHFIRLKPKLDTVQEVSLMDYVQKQFDQISIQLSNLAFSRLENRHLLPDRHEVLSDTIVRAFSRWQKEFEYPKDDDIGSKLELLKYAVANFLTFYAHHFPRLKMTDQDHIMHVVPLISAFIDSKFIKDESLQT